MNFNLCKVVAEDIPESIQLYILTDVESNGPIPSDNSMLSFGSFAVDIDGNIYGIFYANLKCLKESKPNKNTMEWWKNYPQQYKQATYAPLDPAGVMTLYAEWLGSLKCKNIKMVADCSFDWMYMQWYLVHFLSDMPLGYDMIHSDSFAWAHKRRKFNNYSDVSDEPWRSHKYQQTHVSIQDALSGGFSFVNMIRENAKMPLIADFVVTDNKVKAALEMIAELQF
jgi:hypothetical protein